MTAPIALKEQKEQVFAPHALKGQRLLAQGIALGFRTDTKKAPCKGKSFLYVFKAFALTGRYVFVNKKPRALPWARRCFPYRAHVY